MYVLFDSRDVPEYYFVGHDTPEPLFEPSMSRIDRKKISLLFGGIGDARHLYMTLIMVGTQVMMRKLPKDKSFHFTIVDLKPATIATDLLILLTLDELARTPSEDEISTSTLLHVLYYTYAPLTMPRSAYDSLQ